MKSKSDIVSNWLPRYTGMAVEDFSRYILLTNFSGYLKKFAEWGNTEIVGADRAMPCATAGGITMINFGMGSPNTASVCDLLTALGPLDDKGRRKGPKAVLFLGKCGGLKKKNKLGDLILPIGAIRGEGTSDSYLPPEVPALPAFALQKAISTTIRDAKRDYWTGTVYTTNRRVWEHDNKFKRYLGRTRAMAIDMETATLFTAAFKNKFPAGALLLVSDTPMTPEGVKTEASDAKVTQEYVDFHVQMGIDSLKQLMNKGNTVKHLKF
ncbi:MAG: AMP nucleosidase [Saprospiraceae bacterium]